MKNPGSLLLVAAAAAAFAPSMASAALITFGGDTAGQGAAVPSTYQPLQNTYAGTATTGNSTPTPLPYSDGADINVDITWDNSSQSYRATNGGVTDHTNDGAGVVFYDNGNNAMTVTFSQPVTVPSFFYSNFNAGNYNIEFQGYTNVGDTTPVVDLNRAYAQPTGYTWIEETAFGTTPITKLVILGTAFKQIDDITVNAVPEPASLSLIALGALGMFARRRRS